MNHLKLDQSKVPQLVGELKELLAHYQLYRQKLNVFLSNGNFKGFPELRVHFKALHKNTDEDLKQIICRIQVLNYSKVIELEKLPKLAELKIFSDVRNVRLMAESIINFHKFLVDKLKRIISKAEMANDMHTSRLISRILNYFDIESWILSLWIDMYTETVSQRFIRKTQLKRKSEFYPYSYSSNQSDILRNTGM